MKKHFLSFFASLIVFNGLFFTITEAVPCLTRTKIERGYYNGTAKITYTSFLEDEEIQEVTADTPTKIVIDGVNRKMIYDTQTLETMAKSAYSKNFKRITIGRNNRTFSFIKRNTTHRLNIQYILKDFPTGANGELQMDSFNNALDLADNLSNLNLLDNTQIRANKSTRDDDNIIFYYGQTNPSSLKILHQMSDQDPVKKVAHVHFYYLVRTPNVNPNIYLNLRYTVTLNGEFTEPNKDINNLDDLHRIGIAAEQHGFTELTGTVQNNQQSRINAKRGNQNFNGVAGLSAVEFMNMARELIRPSNHFPLRADGLTQHGNIAQYYLPNAEKIDVTIGASGFEKMNVKFSENIFFCIYLIENNSIRISPEGVPSDLTMPNSPNVPAFYSDALSLITLEREIFYINKLSKGNGHFTPIRNILNQARANGAQTIGDQLAALNTQCATTPANCGTSMVRYNQIFNNLGLQIDHLFFTGEGNTNPGDPARSFGNSYGFDHLRIKVKKINP